MRKQLTDLRKAMNKAGITWYLVPTDDFHASEYVGEYFMCRRYLTGFTGSAGVALVGMDWAGLWTDGRYFLQAGMQLQDTGFTLMKSGEPDVPTLQAFLKEKLRAGDVLAFDGRTVTAAACEKYRAIAAERDASVRTDPDLVGEIWPDRPALSAEPVFELDLKYAGKSREEKLRDVRLKMREAGADALILSSLMDICWLMNIRGNDVACTPVVLSFALITASEATLFVNPAVIDAQIRAHLAGDGVRIAPYGEITDAVKRIPAGKTVMMNLNTVNSALYDAVPEGVTVLDKPEPTGLMKAIKNPVEVANFRAAHVKDGVAVTRFMYWLKKNVGKIPMTEISAAEKLESFRKEQPGYLGPSFHPIMGYGPHGAIIHYSATPESNAGIEPRSLLLSDTGGHYLEGTTDITRTFAMGPVTDEERRMFTLVLKGHLKLGAAKFRYGCSGLSLDYLAREPLWALGLDYNHGTGHGVGYVLSVHEGPQAFRWRASDFRQIQALEPGMITSDEPGYYAEGRFGVRHESLTVVCDTETTAYGRFLHLEYLTLVPFDLDAVDPSLMTVEERALLNDYHRQVRETLTPLLPADEAAWLREATREI